MNGLMRDRARLLWAVAVMSPVVVVQFVHWVGGPAGPSEIRAASGAAEPEPPAPALSRAAPTAKALRAAEYLRTLRRDAEVRSPMEEAEDQTPDESESEADGEHEVDEGSPPAAAPNIRITAIVSSRRGSIAMIGRRLILAGDVLGEGWRVVSIDAVTRSVRIEHDDGRVVEYTTQESAERAERDVE